MGPLREQSQGALLSPHRRWPKAAHSPDKPLGRTCSRRQPRSETRPGVNMSLKRFFHRRARRADSALELEAYLQRETEENIERGMSPADARRAAHIKLGNVTNILGDISQQG